MVMIRFFIVLFMVYFTACTTPKSALTYKSDEVISMDVFLQDAITEGLKRDKITRGLALEVVALDAFFIGKCKICKNVKKAFNEHKGFNKEEEMKGQVIYLKEVKNMGDVGKNAIERAVKSYLDQHFEKAGLTSKQKEAIQKELMQESAKGLKLAGGYNFCPSCKGTEGACKIKQL